CQTVVCPPFTYLQQVNELLKANGATTLKLGAQDVSQHESGAFTGQVSGSMLKEMSCDYVIIGHSERRQYNGETNEIVAEKFYAAINAGLTPILCVGETLAQREANETNNVLLAQLNAVLAKAEKRLHKFVLAYEPVW